MIKNRLLPFDFNTLEELLTKSTQMYGENCLCRMYNGKREIKRTFVDLYQDVQNVKKLIFSRSSVHIAFICDYSYEFICWFFGVCCTGNICIPINPALDVSILYEMLTESDSVLLIYDPKYHDSVNKLKDLLPDNFLVIESNAFYKKCDFYLSNQFDHSITPQPQTTAVMLFTSGTARKPKLVMLSHGNLTSNIASVCTHLNFSSEDSIIPILPIYHSLGIITGVLAAFVVGGTICIGRGAKYFIDDMNYYRPTVLVIVPMIAKSLYDKIIRMITSQNKVKQVNRTLIASNFLRSLKLDVRRMIFADLLGKFGGKVKTILCGGAPINDGIVKFFNDIGIDFLTAYGLTECSPVVSLNNSSHNNYTSCGRLIPGVCVKIVEGEIFVMGPNVFKSYYKSVSETEKALVDGWLKTGDLGYFDKKGFLYVVDRKDDLIIFSNGEKIRPSPLEAFYMSSTSVIDEILLYKKILKNNGIEFLVAKIYPVYEVRIMPLQEILQKIQFEIDRINKLLPPIQRIRQIEIVSTTLRNTGLGKISRRQDDLNPKEEIFDNGR